MSELKVQGLSKRFGGLAAVDGVSFVVEPGERRAIIGPNGAGKTTLFNLISGEIPVTSGEIYLEGRNVTRTSPHERARQGLGRTFQKNNCFPSLSVFENVSLAVQRRQACAHRSWRPLSGFAAVFEETAEVLEQFELDEYAEVSARDLSYGVQRQVEVAVAAALRPRILLLDEPTAGMSPSETTHMVEFVDRLPRTITVLIIEHDMDVIFSLADAVTVLHYGRVIADGPPEQVKGNPEVQAVYFGAAGAEGAGKAAGVAGDVPDVAVDVPPPGGDLP